MAECLLTKMMRLAIFISCSLICLKSFGNKKFPENELNSPLTYHLELLSKFQVVQKDLIEPKDFLQSRLFPTDYGDSILKNSGNWQQIKTYQFDLVTLVFTNHQSDILLNSNAFIQLLTARLRHLFSFAPELNNSSIAFQVIIQTKCNTLPCAKELFHGVLLQDINHSSDNFSDKYPTQLIHLQPGKVPTYQSSCGAVGLYTVDLLSFKERLWVSNDSLGILVSNENCDSFSLINNGLETGKNYHLTQYNGKIIASSHSGVFVLNESKNKWLPLLVPLNSNEEIKSVTSSPKGVLMVSNQENLLFSSDLQTWDKRIFKYNEYGITQTPKLGYINVLNLGPIVLISSGMNLYKSGNFGKSWIKVQLPEMSTGTQFIQGVFGDSTKTLISTYPNGIYYSDIKHNKWSKLPDSIDSLCATQITLVDDAFLIHYVNQYAYLAVKNKKELSLLQSHFITCKPISHGEFIYFGLVAGVLYKIPKKSFNSN